MATGLESFLNVVHAGEQSAWGSAVTPDTYIVGVTEHRARVETTIHRPDNEHGLAGPSDLAQVTRRSVQLNITDEPVYEQLQIWLDMLFGKASPSGSGPYTRTYVGPLYEAITPQFYTFGRGQNGFYFTYPDTAAKTLEFRYSVDDGFILTATLLSSDQEPATWTAINRPAGLTPIPVLNAKVFIDLPSASPGTTEIPGVLRSATIHIDNGLHYKYFPGSERAQGYGTGKWDVYIQATLEMTSTVQNLYNEVLTAIPDLPERWVRLQFQKDSDHDLMFTLFGTLESSGDDWGDADGNVVWDVTFRASFAASGNWFETVLVNTVS